MRKILFIAGIFLSIGSASAQIPIQLDSSSNGLFYFSITDTSAIHRIDTGAVLHVWAWNANQLEVTQLGRTRIKGYNKNFDITSSSTFQTRKGYLNLLCEVNWCVWATIDQPFGYRPPLYLDQVVNPIMFNTPCTVDTTSNTNMYENLNETRLIKPIGFKHWETIIPDSICGDSLETQIIGNQIVFSYDVSAPYNAYSFAVGTSYGNITLYKVNYAQGTITGTLEANSGLFVSHANEQVTMNLPATSMIYMGVVAWNTTNSTCPQSIYHWQPKLYVKP